MRPIQALHSVEGHSQVLGIHRQGAAGGLQLILLLVSAVAEKIDLLREVRVGVIDFRPTVLRMVAACNIEVAHWSAIALSAPAFDRRRQKIGSKTRIRQGGAEVWEGLLPF